MLPSFGKDIWTVDTWREAHIMINCTVDGSTLYMEYQEILHLLKHVCGHICWCTGCVINSVTHVFHSYAVLVISPWVVIICLKLGCHLHLKIPHTHTHTRTHYKNVGQYRGKLLVHNVKSGLRLTTFSISLSVCLSLPLPWAKVTFCEHQNSSRAT
jgi:hypothetical protein